MFGASTETLPYGLSYMNIYVCGTIFVQLALGMNPFISTQGYATTSMLTVLIGAITNIVLDPILIFGFNMGVQGAALATILSQALSAAWVIRFLYSKKTQLRIRTRYFKIKPAVILPVMALGVSPFIMQSTESLVNIALNSSLQRYGGDIAVGAMTIVGSVMQFCLMPLQGLTQGGQPIISFNYGARQNDRVKQAFRYVLIAAVCYSAALWCLSMFTPQLFVSMFTNKPELFDKAVWALRIYMAGSIVFGIQIACQQTFVALGQAKVSLFMALLRKIVLLIPLIFILPPFFADKVFAVFLAEPVADVVASLTTGTVFLILVPTILKKNVAGELHS